MLFENSHSWREATLISSTRNTIEKFTSNLWRIVGETASHEKKKKTNLQGEFVTRQLGTRRLEVSIENLSHHQANDWEKKLVQAATGTPTPTCRAKHCLLQEAAHHWLELKEADVSGGIQ